MPATFLRRPFTLPILFLQSLLDSLFQQVEDFLDIGKRRFRIVVVIHQTVLVLVSLCQYVINHKSGFLHRRAAMFKVAADLVRRSFQGTVQAELLRICQADPIVFAVPFRR
jgi:hypothetical protein